MGGYFLPDQWVLPRQDHDPRGQMFLEIHRYFQRAPIEGNNRRIPIPETQPVPYHGRQG